MSLQILKSKDRVRCPAFLNYVRAQPCEDCRVLKLKQRTGTTASHTISIKWAEGSDSLVVPQCLLHHPQSSRSAKEGLEKHGVDVPELHVRLWNGFLEEQGINVRVSTQAEFERLLSEHGLTEKSFSRRKNR